MLVSRAVDDVKRWLFIISLVARAAAAQPSSTPSEAEAALALARATPGTKPVAVRVLADLGGRVPVLFFTSPPTRVRVAILKRQGGWFVGETLELPCTASISGEARWAEVTVKDLDGDGQPELVAVYDYEHRDAEVDDGRLRDLAIVHLSPQLTTAFTLNLNNFSFGEDGSTAEWKLVRRRGAAPDIVTTTTGFTDGEPGQSEKRRYRYDSHMRRWRPAHAQ
jgi:hypothetical protein